MPNITPVCAAGEHLDHVVYKGRGCIARCYIQHPHKRTKRCSREQYHRNRAVRAVLPAAQWAQLAPPAAATSLPLPVPACSARKRLYWVMQGRRCVHRCLVGGPRPETRRCSTPQRYKRRRPQAQLAPPLPLPSPSERVTPVPEAPSPNIITPLMEPPPQNPYPTAEV